MVDRKIDSRLIKKKSKFSNICTSCDNKIEPDEVYYLEKGIKEHVHSLIARKFCQSCYAKYGERILLKGK